MAKERSIVDEDFDSPAIKVSLDTINIGKQALVFVNTKKGAEATAEKIAGHVKSADTGLEDLSQKILGVLSSPTKQCRRLAACIKKGVAFHHAGLPSGQRTLIEDNFRKGLIRIICATPTLAMGVNLPAFRVIMKDLKRYGGRWGMEWISTLEYHQCTGRAGRPDFNDKFGEAICFADNEADKSTILERFIYGEPESIYSKLAVEPILRTYVLSLIAIGFASTEKEMLAFFAKTFYGFQFKDMKELEAILRKITGLLEEWEFIKVNSGGRHEFVSADSLNETLLEATPLGRRVAELYIDPFTANYIITSLRRATQKHVNEFSFLSMACNTIEIKPSFKARSREITAVEAFLNENSSELIILEPSVFEPQYDDFLDGIKTALVFIEWMDEKDEEYMLETYGVTPGEFKTKLDIADWILYAAEEMASLLQFRDIIKVIRKTRFRLDHGIKEELIPLVRLRGIGRKRARKLFRNGIKDLGDVKSADLGRLAELIGRETAISIKKEVGMNPEKEIVSEGKRKGQISMKDYQE